MQNFRLGALPLVQVRALLRALKKLRAMRPCVANKQKRINESSFLLATMVNKDLRWPKEASQHRMAKRRWGPLLVGGPLVFELRCHKLRFATALSSSS